jgi:predicted Rossmann fold nucleotide-binding protein DprA/Smf involved in DNA uptake
VADFLDARVKEIEGRLQELRPLIEEYHRLEAASAALSGSEAPARSRGARARANGSSAGRRGRPRGTRGDDTRATQAVELVRAQPGITIPELAQHMGIKPNYLYRILPQLEEDGRVRRDDKGWFPG